MRKDRLETTNFVLVLCTSTALCSESIFLLYQKCPVCEARTNGPCTTAMKVILASLGLVVAIVVILDTGSAIKCFQCNSYHQHDCADWFDNVTQHLTQCADDQHLCRKVVQEAFFDGKWEVRYVRQCASAGEVGAFEGRVCQERIGTYRVKMRYCHCDNQDGCNSSGTLTTLTPTIVAVLVTLVQYLLPKL